MQSKKQVLTTGQVAQICKVAPRTVTKWFDTGRLKGYRIPGSKDRRIPAGELIKFMKSHDMPTEGLEMGRMRVLIIDGDWEVSSKVAQYLEKNKNYQVQTTKNNFDAGIAAQKLLPHVIVINLMCNDINADQICTYVRANEELSTTRVIAVAAGLGENEKKALLQKGYDAAVSDLTDLETLVRVIDEHTSIVN